MSNLAIGVHLTNKDKINSILKDGLKCNPKIAGESWWNEKGSKRPCATFFYPPTLHGLDWYIRTKEKQDHSDVTAILAKLNPDESIIGDLSFEGSQRYPLTKQTYKSYIENHGIGRQQEPEIVVTDNIHKDQILCAMPLLDVISIIEKHQFKIQTIFNNLVEKCEKKREVV